MHWDGKQIQRLRKKLGLSQVEFGKLVGIHQPTVAALEAGRREASQVYQRLFTFLDALSKNLSVDQLFDLVQKYVDMTDQPSTEKKGAET